MEEEKNDLEKILLQIACKEQLIDPIIEFNQNGNFKGQGYLGIIQMVQLRGKNKDLNLIVKWASKSDKLRKCTPIRNCFLTEIYFYEKVLSEFLKFQSDFNIPKPFVNVPKCYVTSTLEKQELLVLRNISNDGFAICNDSKPFQYEHLEMTLKECAHFHGLSFAMKERNMEMFEEITNGMSDILPAFYMEKSFLQMIIESVKVVQGVFKESGREDVEKIFEAFCEDLGPYLVDCKTLNEHSIIIHGDCWSNNFMFKYQESDDTSKPMAMQILDFQILKHGSPVQDLSYLLFTGSNQNLFKDLNKYIDIYYEELRDTLKKFDYDVEKVYSKDNFMKDWKKYAKYGFARASLTLPAVLSSPETAPDLQQAAELQGNLLGCFKLSSEAIKECRDRLKIAFLCLVENKLI